MFLCMIVVDNNINTDRISESVQNKMYNLQIRLKQFKEQTKKLKNTGCLVMKFSKMTIMKAFKCKYFALVSEHAINVLCNYRPKSYH